MNSEDEKRLARLHLAVETYDRNHRNGLDTVAADRKWLLAKLDESERARKVAEEDLAHVQQAGIDALAALTEERAKQEEWCSRKEQLATLAKVLEEERAKREAAEARVAKLEARLAELYDHE